MPFNLLPFHVIELMSEKEVEGEVDLIESRAVQVI